MTERQIVLIESNAILRGGLERVLTDRGFVVSHTLKSIAELPEIAAATNRLTVILSSGRNSGLEQEIAQIRSMQSNAAIILLGGRYSIQSAIEAIQFGANACLDDETTPDAFFRSLEFASNDVMLMCLSDRARQIAVEPVAPFAPAIAAARVAPDASVAPAARVEAAGPSEKMPVVAGVAAQVNVASFAAAPSPAAPPQAPKAVEFHHARAVEINPKEGDAFSFSERSGDTQFSPRERSVLSLLQKGEPNKKIARDLGLTEATVKVHLKSILRKMGANNRTQAAVWALKYNGSHHSDDMHGKVLNGSRN